MAWQRLNDLWLLVPLMLAMIFVFMSNWKTGQQIKRLLHPNLLADGQLQGHRQRLILRLIAFVAFVVAWLGPLYGQQAYRTQKQQRDIVMVVDFSRSMYAQDLVPNRLTKVREAVNNILESYPGYRYALVVFAGDAWVRIPFTYDRDYVKLVIDETDPNEIQPQGTDIARALQAVLALVTAQKRTQTTAVIITDGEHLSSDSIVALIPQLKEQHVQILAVAVGSMAGAAIPDGRGGWLNDPNGQPARSVPDTTSLQMLAQKTDGAFVHIDGQSFTLNALADSLAAVQAIADDIVEQQKHVDRADIPIAMGLIFLIWSLLPLRFLVFFRQQSLTNHKLLLGLMVALMPLVHCTWQNEPPIEALSDQDRLATATTALVAEPSAKHFANLGLELYNLKRYDQALGAFVQAASLFTQPKDKSNQLYHAGNAAFRLGNLLRAINFYEQALGLYDDSDTHANLELAKRYLAQLQQAKPPQAQQEKNNSGNEDEAGNADQADGNGDQQNNQENTTGNNGQQQNQTTQADKPDSKNQKNQDQQTSNPKEADQKQTDQKQNAQQNAPQSNNLNQTEQAKRPSATQTQDQQQTQLGQPQTGKNDQEKNAALQSATHMQPADTTMPTTSLGTLLKHRLEQLQEANPMAIPGEGHDGEKPW